MKCDKWSQKADINEQRVCAACTVCCGKLVVSGGYNDNTLKSVEAYDYFENRWSCLPDMIEERYFHALGSMGNKLFVISAYEQSTCELFDSWSRKFCYMKTCAEFSNGMSSCQSVCISNQLIIFVEYCRCQTKMFTYNVETSEWKLIDCGYLKNKCRAGCIKYHQ